MIPRLPVVSMEEILANSYRDFHVRGFDYVCIRRSPQQTVKLYFFDGDVSKLPEVVSPHDHRYDFRTIVVAGKSQNVWYSEASARESAAGEGTVFNRFAYDTPLLGGSGFVHVGETRLVERARTSYKKGGKYDMKYREVHTIKMMESETVLCLVQHEDRVTDSPTLTFIREDEPPSLSGLYSKPTADQVMNRLRNLKDRVPGLNLPMVA